MEITAPCPAWCRLRADDHGADVLADRYHFGEEHLVELSRHNPEKQFDDRVLPGELQVILEQAPYIRTSQVTIINEDRGGTYGRMSLPEARRLRRALGKLIAMGEECATPDALPTLDAVLADMRAKVAEDSNLDSQSSGYALGDAGAEGWAWLCVSADLAPDLREETVRNLLVDVFEKRCKAL
ncbi:DUF6907 domain-containing protein [Streptomyces sp. NPDC053474]|uniref:DUF6907 domain-containing protein n=1 Tax=Streptomyces sp. NPDC053474 TaxID=3365704 RepID=UPI0037D37CA3